MRFVMTVKRPENAGPLPKELREAITSLSDEAAAARIMLWGGELLPTAQSTHIRLSKRKLTVTDGPFAETKEVVGGYALFELNSKEEAIEWAVRFMELHKKHWPGWEGEIEVHQISEREEIARYERECFGTAAAMDTV